MKKYLLFVLFGLTVHLSFSQDEALEAKYHDLVSTFVDCFKNEDINKLKTLIEYPLYREYPIPDVKDEEDFVIRYDQIFDEALIEEIINSDLSEDWSSVGWRGIMLYRGTLWLNYDGKLKGINYQSIEEKALWEALVEEDKNSIHKSLKEYKEPILVLETEKFRIRIDELNNGFYRYASWSIDSEMNEKPSLIIKNGEVVFSGSGGNHHYTFSNGNYKYECSINVLRGKEVAPAHLVVYKNEDEILLQSAQIIRK